MDIADSARRCAVARAVALADCVPLGVRAGLGWIAIRSGARSNDLNVVVSDLGFLPSTTLVAELTHWFTGVPASWMTEEPDKAFTDVVASAGWTPERTGRSCGRVLAPIQPETGGVEASRLEVVNQLRVGSSLDDWLEIAWSCGWFDDPADLEVRRHLMRGMVADPRRAAWVATLHDRPVGMATAWCDDGAVELVDVAVRTEARRHGVATALVARVTAWGTHRGATEVVAAPSPDGWRLMKSLGFDNVGVVPDTCFYLTDAP